MVIFMKFLLSFFLLLFLSACQTTSNFDVDGENDSTNQVTGQTSGAEFDDEEGLAHLLPPKDSNSKVSIPGNYENIWLKLADGFEFDVPVRFDADRINSSLAGFAAGEIPSVPVVEVRV
jgi:membrane-bound lytic murein transglycosylase D